MTQKWMVDGNSNLKQETTAPTNARTLIWPIIWLYMTLPFWKEQPRTLISFVATKFIVFMMLLTIVTTRTNLSTEVVAEDDLVAVLSITKDNLTVRCLQYLWTNRLTQTSDFIVGKLLLLRWLMQTPVVTTTSNIFTWCRGCCRCRWMKTVVPSIFN